MTWNDYPLTLTMHQVAEILGLHVSTVRKRVLQGSPLVPPPSFIKPYAWRRDDVQRFHETASVQHFRRAVARDQQSA